MLVRIRAYLARDDGNVESALVLIPMLFLFLIGAQVISATNLRNADLAMAQGEAAERAISQEFNAGDEVLEIGGGVEKIPFVSAAKISILFSTSDRVVVGSLYCGLESISSLNLLMNYCTCSSLKITCWRWKSVRC